MRLRVILLAILGGEFIKLVGWFIKGVFGGLEMDVHLYMGGQLVVQ